MSIIAQINHNSKLSRPQPGLGLRKAPWRRSFVSPASPLVLLEVRA